MGTFVYIRKKLEKILRGIGQINQCTICTCEPNFELFLEDIMKYVFNF